MKEDTKEVETNETRLSDKNGNIEEGSVTSVDQVSIRTGKNNKTDEGDYHSMRAESMIGKDGGTLDIQNTGVSLEIPPGALRRDYLVKMRIIPQHYRDKTESPVTSFSSVVVELLPNNVNLLKPATLVIPHCLVLKKKCGWKAKVYSSHHKEGNQPQWEEERNTKCDVTYENCVMLLRNFSWKKFEVKGRKVKAIRIILFAAKRFYHENEIFLDIGYYWDLPSCQEIISFSTVAILKGSFCTFLLNKMVSDGTDESACCFKAGQGSRLVDLIFSLKESSLSRTEAIIPSTGNATAGDTNDSGVSEESLLMYPESNRLTNISLFMTGEGLSSRHHIAEPTCLAAFTGTVRAYVISKVPARITAAARQCIAVQTYLKDYTYLSEHIGEYWKFVGRNLGVTEEQFSNIEQKVDASLKEKTYQMLRVWQMKMASAANFDVLGKALSEAGRVDLQQYLLTKYQPT
ncbi:hypothetical protein BSL78_23405 [Apostichopus japonicus]|uniref:Death domain-containing protein n=1 Tax=Stichopus japonicus TaxID=307972 RepID=A0A2G8JVF0_STIJA|nr:hypothetical protein BSL78_23405 [Apostichopus japonicus]